MGSTAAGWWRGGVGWELSGMLSNELSSSGDFRVVERAKLEQVLDEQNLGGADKLRDIPTVDVAELQFLPHNDAVKRWGSDIKGSVTLTASAGSTYLWSNGATTQAITVNASGNYSVTVTTGGCSAAWSWRRSTCASRTTRWG